MWLRAILAVEGFENTNTEKDLHRRKRLAYTDRKNAEYGPAPRHYRVLFVRRDRPRENPALRSVGTTGRRTPFYRQRPNTGIPPRMRGIEKGGRSPLFFSFLKSHAPQETIRFRPCHWRIRRNNTHPA